MSTTQDVRRDAELARSSIGASLPSALVDKLVELAHDTGYSFSIGSANELSRKTRFFRDNQKKLRFFDRYGEEFTFSDSARPILKNEIFVGIAFFHDKQTARVYARFP